MLLLLDMRRRFKAVMDVLDAMVRYGVSLSHSVELSARWDRVLSAGLLYPVTLDDLDAVQGLGIGDFSSCRLRSSSSSPVFIIVLVISFMRLLFILVMRRSGAGGIGFGKTPRCFPIGGFVLIWFPQLLFFSVSPILRLVVLGCLLILPKFMRNSERLGFPTVVVLEKGRPALIEEFDPEVEGWLPLLPELALPRLTGQMLADVVQREGATAGGLDGWEVEGVEGLACFLV